MCLWNICSSIYCLSVKGSQFQAPAITLCCSQVYLKFTPVHTCWAPMQTPAHVLICATHSLLWPPLLLVPRCSLEKLIRIPLPWFKTIGFQRTLIYAVAEAELDRGWLFPLSTHHRKLFPGLKEKERELPRALPALFCILSQFFWDDGARIWKSWSFSRTAGLFGMSAFTFC